MSGKGRFLHPGGVRPNCVVRNSVGRSSLAGWWVLRVSAWTQRQSWVPAVYFPEAPILPNAQSSEKFTAVSKIFLWKSPMIPAFDPNSGWGVSLRPRVALTSVGMNLSGYEGLGSIRRWVTSVWVKKAWITQFDADAILPGCVADYDFPLYL